MVEKKVTKKRVTKKKATKKKLPTRRSPQILEKKLPAVEGVSDADKEKALALVKAVLEEGNITGYLCYAGKTRAKEIKKLLKIKEVIKDFDLYVNIPKLEVEGSRSEVKGSDFTVEVHYKGQLVKSGSVSI